MMVCNNDEHDLARSRSVSILLADIESATCYYDIIDIINRTTNGMTSWNNLDTVTRNALSNKVLKRTGQTFDLKEVLHLEAIQQLLIK